MDGPEHVRCVHRARGWRGSLESPGVLAIIRDRNQSLPESLPAPLYFVAATQILIQLLLPSAQGLDLP